MDERAEPTPGPYDVLVRMRAWSLNHRDLLIAEGRYGRDVKPDVITLSDGAGDVVDIGDRVTRWRRGDRVVGAFLPNWSSGPVTAAKLSRALGGSVDGVLADYVSFHEDALVGAPAHLNHAEAATLPCAAVTAWQCLVVQGGLAPGQTILVLGSGGVSVFALQFAVLGGARVIATSSSDAKLDRLRQLGAAEGLHYLRNPRWGRLIRELTGGGVDHVVEVGGAGTLPESIAAVRPGGRLSIVGVLSDGGGIDHVRLLRKALTLHGVYVGSRQAFESMNRAIEWHGMRPVIDRAFPFTEAAAAYRYLASGSHLGKVVIAAG